MSTKPTSSRARLMLVIAALFAFVTVGFNTAAYAKAPKRHQAIAAVALSIGETSIAAIAPPASERLHVSRHLAHQPQILPDIALPLVTLPGTRPAWQMPLPSLRKSHIYANLLRPPRSGTV